MVKACIDDEDDDDEEFKRMNMMSSMSNSLLASDTSVWSWVEEDSFDEFFNLFFIVEFQKFFISLSVRPGKRAAI